MLPLNDAFIGRYIMTTRREKFGINHWQCMCTSGTPSWFNSINTCIDLCSVFKDCQPGSKVTYGAFNCGLHHIRENFDVENLFFDRELKYIRQIKYLQALNEFLLNGWIAHISILKGFVKQKTYKQMEIFHQSASNIFNSVNFFNLYLDLWQSIGNPVHSAICSA